MPHAPVGRARVAAALLVLAVAACGGSAATPSSGAGGSPGASAALVALPRQVDVAGAVALRDAGAFVLDVREPDEWAAGHIDGATLIPLWSVASRAGELPRDRDIVVVCRSGNRSAQARDILLAAGFRAVTSMAGGMTAWTAAGHPVVSGE